MLHDKVSSCCMLVLQVLSTALVKAERENATVYLQQVPNFADLPPIQPYILVKSLPLTDVDASQESLFQSVIPDSRCLLVSLISSGTCSPLPLCWKQAVMLHTIYSSCAQAVFMHSLPFQN